MGWHRIAVGFDGDQPLTTDHHAIEEAVVLRRGWERPKGALLLCKPLDGWLSCSIRGALRIDALQPGAALLCQVGLIMKRAAGDEVPLHIFHQVLDGSFLVSRCWSARLGMKFELHSQLLVGRI